MKFLTQKRLRKGPFLCTVHKSSGENLPNLNAIVINRAVEARKLKLFPNPDRDKVMLGLSNDFIHIMVVDKLGRVIYARDVKGDESVRLDVSHYKAGIYLLKFLNSSGDSFTMKLVVAG